MTCILMTYLEQDEEGVGKCFKVEKVVDAGNLLHVGKLGHSYDRIDEHEEEEEAADVEEGG